MIICSDLGGHDEYQGFTKENDHLVIKPKTSQLQGLGVVLFECFQKVLLKHDTFRETADEEGEMRYLIKGRDFIIHLCMWIF